MSITAEDLRTILTRPIAFHRLFASVGGSVGAGVFLSQLYYWGERTDDPDGWVYKTSGEWYEETMLGRRELDTVRKVLRTKGVIEEKLAGVPATMHYRLKWDEPFESLKEAAQDHRERVERRRAIEIRDFQTIPQRVQQQRRPPACLARLSPSRSRLLLFLLWKGVLKKSPSASSNSRPSWQKRSGLRAIK